MASRTHTSMIAALLVCVALVGCGDDTDPAPDSAAQPTQTEQVVNGDAREDFSVDACSLLTAEQVAAATGASAEEGEFNAALSNGQQSVCEWQTDASAVAFVQVVVSQSNATAERATAEEVLGVAADTDVPGATDGYVVDGLVGAQAGPHFVQVTVIPADDDAAVELAGLAVALLDN